MAGSERTLRNATLNGPSDEEGIKAHADNGQRRSSSQYLQLTTIAVAAAETADGHFCNIPSSVVPRRRSRGQRWRRQCVAYFLRLAIRWLRRGWPHIAFVLLRGLTEIAPDITSVRVWRTRAALADGDLMAAEESIGLSDNDASTDMRLNCCRLAALHLKMENLDDAARYLEQARTVVPESIRVWSLLGELSDRQGNVDEAVAHFRRYFDVAPLPNQQLRALFQAGAALTAAGRDEQAALVYREITERFPSCTMGYFRLIDALFGSANCVDIDDSLIKTVQQLVESPSIAVSEKAHLHFALGVVHDKRRDVGMAFAHFMLANQLAGRNWTAHWNPEAALEERREVFNEEMIAELSQYGCQDDFLICIVGMPRSGTTLVEQILAAHSQVSALGERKEFCDLAARLPKELKHKRGYPLCCRRLSPEIVRAKSHFLRERLRRLSGTSIRCVVKSPGDTWEVGLIKILFPKARFIHMQRNPIDTCWSCFVQNFKAIPFATSLEELAAVHRACDRIVQHWREVLPAGSILDVPYEDLVANSKAIARTIYEFCGLSFDENCLQFYRNRQPVYTSSHWQIRKPIYGTSVRRSERYRQFLGPLLALEQTKGRDDRVVPPS